MKNLKSIVFLSVLVSCLTVPSLAQTFRTQWTPVGRVNVRLVCPSNPTGSGGGQGLTGATGHVEIGLKLQCQKDLQAFVDLSPENLSNIAQHFPAWQSGATYTVKFRLISKQPVSNGVLYAFPEKIVTFTVPISGPYQAQTLSFGSHAYTVPGSVDFLLAYEQPAVPVPIGTGSTKTD